LHFGWRELSSFGSPELIGSGVPQSAKSRGTVGGPGGPIGGRRGTVGGPISPSPSRPPVFWVFFWSGDGGGRAVPLRPPTIFDRFLLGGRRGTAVPLRPPTKKAPKKQGDGGGRIFLDFLGSRLKFFFPRIIRRLWRVSSETKVDH
jgi:hypothetical protein